MRILHSKKLVLVSKPRCGSTSARILLNDQMEDGDEYCDYAGQFPNLHPHMTAAAIQSYINASGHEAKSYTYFTVTRHPLEMLWSWYKFFKPDVNSRYKWDEGYLAGETMDFEEWVVHGRLGYVQSALLYPTHISDQNLSTLSLEAFICDSSGDVVVDRYFKLEQRLELEEWLSEIFEAPLKLPRTNASNENSLPELSDQALAHVVSLFPFESRMYAMDQ